MSSIDTTIEEEVIDDPIASAILRGGAPLLSDASAVVEEPVEDPAGEPPTAPEGEPGGEPVEETIGDLILGKFKTSEDLAEGYKNLESQFTQNNQRLKDLEDLLSTEDEEPQRPAWNAPFAGADPANEAELVGWAENDPGAAAQWAITNNDRIPAEMVNSLWEHWFERKPTDAMAWYTQQQTASISQQYEARLTELQEQIAPLRDQQTSNMFESSLTALEGQIPDLADYSQKIQDYIDHIPVDQLHLAFFPNGMDTPEKVQEGIKSLYAIVRMREPLAQQSQVTTNQAFTQQRQGVADTGPTDYDAKINAAILNG